MGDYRRIQIQANDLQVFRFSKAESRYGFEHGERLERLQGIKIVAITLVGEIETWPDDCNAAHAAGRECAFL